MPDKKKAKTKKAKTKVYCGFGKIPANHERGSVEECLEKKQVRYYGRVAIPKNIMKKFDERGKQKKQDEVNELLKYRKLQDQAKALIKQSQILKIIIQKENAPDAKIKKAKAEFKELLKKRDVLVKKIMVQKKVLQAIEKAKQDDSDTSDTSDASDTSDTSDSE